MASCFIESLGCAKNLVDSEVFAQLMVDRGLSYTEKIEEADLVLVNTCAFIQDARNELDQVLSNMMEIVSAEQLLVVTGCIMNNGLEKFKYLFPDVDAWIGLKDFVAFSAFLDEKFPGTQAHLGAGDRYPIDNNPYAYLRISDGCLNNCSYCTIPRIRGSLSSIPIKALVREAERLALRGAKELAIIAQDTCNYGLDLSGERQLPALLAELH
ncbi:MAG: 2-alkenal reductase, partial [Candidatus Cloacimonetes bacterium]|nr:2-alkenal reductase [Candidatus Cloacimonadota bacterium]